MKTAVGELFFISYRIGSQRNVLISKKINPDLLFVGAQDSWLISSAQNRQFKNLINFQRSSIRLTSIAQTLKQKPVSDQESGSFLGLN